MNCSPALAGFFFVGDFFAPANPSSSHDAHLGSDRLPRRCRYESGAEGARLSSTGAAGAVELAVQFGPLDLGEPARNGPCQRVGILAHGPNWRQFLAGGGRPIPRPPSALFPFIFKIYSPR